MAGLKLGAGASLLLQNEGPVLKSSSASTSIVAKGYSSTINTSKVTKIALNNYRRFQNITFVDSFLCKPGLLTFSVQFRHVTYITVYVGMVENSGKMLASEFLSYSAAAASSCLYSSKDRDVAYEDVLVNIAIVLITGFFIGRLAFGKDY